jgi:hypothetical protein
LMKMQLLNKHISQCCKNGFFLEWRFRRFHFPAGRSSTSLVPGCLMFSESIPTSTVDRLHREWRPGTSVPAKIWSHTLWLLVGIHKRSSLCTTSTNNFRRPKKQYQSCSELSDARQSSSGVGQIQLPFRCCPWGWRRAHSTFINFIVNTIKCNWHHIYY